MSKTSHQFPLLYPTYFPNSPAFAGEMGTPGSPAPPPTTSAVQEPTDEPTLNGEIHTPGESESLPESITQITLELLAVLPSIL